MTLSEYLEREGEKPSAFAKRIDRSPSFISLLLDGKRGVSMETARVISDATNGEVSFADWASSDSEAAA